MKTFATNESRRLLGRLAMSVLAVGVLSASASSAQANDGKVYSASGCNATESTKNVIRRNSLGRLYNSSNTRNTFITCPIVKDTMSSTQNVNSHVWVKNRGSRSLFCTHVSKNSYTGSNVNYYTTRSASASSYWKKLQFGTTQANSWGPQYLYCLIPSASTGQISWLGNYYIEED